MSFANGRSFLPWTGLISRRPLQKDKYAFTRDLPAFWTQVSRQRTWIPFCWFCQLCQELLLPSQPDAPPKHFTNHIVFNKKLLQPIQASHDTTLGQFWNSFGTTCLLFSDHWQSVPLPYGQQMVILFTKFSLKNSRETIDTAFLGKASKKNDFF